RKWQFRVGRYPELFCSGDRLMHELTIALNYATHTAGLDSALRPGLSGKLIGVSTYGPITPISIWMDDSATNAEDATATTIAAAHDPALLAVDKTDIQANGTDTATITVTAPKPGAAAVTLTVNGTDYPITLANGVGRETITALDPGPITASVKNPSNRSTDQ